MIKKFWVEEEIQKLREFSKAGSQDRIQICKELNRTWPSIQNKMNSLKIPIPDLRPEIELLDDENITDEQSKKTIKHLQAQIKELTIRKKIVVHNFYDRERKIGIVSDTQMGSLYERLDVLDVAYDCFKREGITSVYHAGDLCDGEKMYRGHEYEIAVHGADAQIKYCIDNYPYRKDITTYFITGNHDLSFWKQSGTDIGERIAEGREDMVYLGKENVNILMGKGKRKITFNLLHPGKGTAYALSYQPQKYIEALSGGQKPHIIVMGHYHKAEMLPTYRNILLIQAGCLQSQTPFMQRSSIAAHLGYWILEFSVDIPHLISRFKAEFFAVYEKERVALEV